MASKATNWFPEWFAQNKNHLRLMKAERNSTAAGYCLLSIYMIAQWLIVINIAVLIWIAYSRAEHVGSLLFLSPFLVPATVLPLALIGLIRRSAERRIQPFAMSSRLLQTDPTVLYLRNFSRDENIANSKMSSDHLGGSLFFNFLPIGMRNMAHGNMSFEQQLFEVSMGLVFRL